MDLKSPQIMQLWINCDPGNDDMLAIILAATHPYIKIIGISTSFGNSTVENTTKNALDILYSINREDIPVIQGSSKPLFGNFQVSPDFHGDDGLCGMTLPSSPVKPILEEPYLRIYNLIMASQDPVYFVNTCCMTNLALLLTTFPEIRSKIKMISMMAGAVGHGNCGAAEFNVMADPYAASLVFDSGVPITMVPLEVTHNVLATEHIFQRFQKIIHGFGSKLVALFRVFQQNYLTHEEFEFPAVHDPCAVFFLLEPESFQGRKARVDIDVYPKSYGRTNCDFRSKSPNAFVCQKIDVERFWEAMFRALHTPQYRLENTTRQQLIGQTLNKDTSQSDNNQKNKQ